MIFFDFEVFKEDWLVVFIDVERQRETVIINDRDRLEAFYRENAKRLHVGYNVRNYDQWIYKAVLAGFDPKAVNDWIIVEGRKGFEFSETLRRFPIIFFDLFQNIDRGLKFFEASMGNDIRETTVPFDIGRKLTEEEIEETVRYCRHDVEQTIALFIERKADFDAQLGLVRMFELPLSDMGKTKAQLAAKVLGATRQRWRDEFDIDLPPTLRVERYTEVVDWYRDPSNRKYRVDPENEKSAKHNLKTTVAGVPHVFGWGGVHGARERYRAEGYFINMDVASLYPSLMIRYGLMSRSVPNPDKYREIRDMRVRFKHEGNPLQAPLKIVLNSTYGAMKDKYNALFDPRQANRVCVYGQLLLLDLMERLEEVGAEIIQSNTDGVLVKMPEAWAGGPDAFFEAVDDAAWEWESRTGLELEFDEYSKVIQKDVNNYLMVTPDGKRKSKGAWVKRLGALDNDLPVVNRAIVANLAEGKPIEETVAEATELRDFQMIVRASRKYSGLLHGGIPLNERTARVFASRVPTDGGMAKVHAETGKALRCAGTPEHCFLYNGDLDGIKAPRKLDRGWYIDLARRRLSEFGA